MKDFRRSISFSSWREKIAYSLGILGKELVQGLINLCVFFYCMQVLDPEPAFLCALYIGFHFLGTFATPVIGFLIDNTSSRFGKYKPWIFTGTLLNTLALVWMYYIPGGDFSSVYLNLTMAYTLWAISFFMIDAATWSMLTIFNSDSSTRDAMASIPCIATSVGTYLLPLCILPLLHYYPDLISVDDSEYQLADLISIATLILSQGILLLFIRTKHIAKRRARTIRRNSHQHMLPPFPKDEPATSDAAANANSAANSNGTATGATTANEYDSAQGNTEASSTPEPSIHSAAVENIYANLSHGAPANNSTSATSSIAASVAAGAAASSGAGFGSASASSALASSAAYGYSGLRQNSYNSEQAQNNIKQCYENNTSYFDRCASLNDDKRPGYVHSSDGTAPESLRDVYADLNAHDMATPRELPDDNPLYAYAREGAFATAAGSYAASFQDPNSMMNTNPTYPVSTETICAEMKNMLHVILKNDQLMVLFICGVLINICLGITIGATFNFLSYHKLMNDHSIFTALIVGSLLQLTCMALYEPMVRMLSRAFVFNFSVYLFLGGIFVLFSAHNATEMMTALITAAVILINCSIGMCHVSLTSMTVDTVDYGEFKLSKRNDALIFAMRITSVHLGNTVSFFCFGGAMAATFIFEDVHYPLPVININMVAVIVTILCLVTLLIYGTYYKLNGSFYRNVLNNLQYLRQSMGVTESVDNGPFMLRYALDESTMIVKLKARTQDDIIRAMVQKLSKVNAITSEPDYISDLNQRMELGPCGVAEGIALPHAKSASVRRATVVVATLDTPIDLGAMDGRKSDLIFLLASPDDGETHLKLLGRLSLLLNEPGFADKLRACGSTTEIFERLIQCEKHVVK